MTIKYLDAKRIRGSSTGAVTSDYTSDFTSCSTDGNCVGWDSSDTTKFYVDVSDDKYFFNVNASYKSSEFDFDDATYAPNVGTLTTKYVVRWKMKFTALSGSAVYWELGMSNSTGERNATQYFEGLHMRENSYRISVTPNATPEGTTATYMSGTESVTWNTTDTYYFELIRDDASFTLNRYTADDYTTGKTTLTLTITSGTWGATTLTAVMRYFRIITNNSATDTGHVFDVKFWNNVSSTTQDEKATLIDTYGWQDFDGSADYITIPTSPLGSIGGSDDFSIAFWVKTDDFAGGGAPALLGCYGADSEGGFQLYENGGALKLTNSTTTLTSSITGIEDSAWHHIAVTRSGSTLTFYKNGSSSSTHSYGSESLPAPDTYMQIARRGDNAQYCDMQLQDLGFWSRALSSADVAVLAGGVPIDKATLATAYTTDLEGYYKFNGDYNDSKSGSSNHGVGTSTADPNTTSDGKFNKVSDLPENTLFEETDTYKTWWLTGDDTWVTKAWRGVFMGGESTSIMDYISIDTKGNATTFGSSGGNNSGIGTCSSHTRGVGSHTGSGAMNFITIATLSNTTTFGNLSASRYGTSGVDDLSRGVFAGGYNGGTSQYTNTIDYITIATAGTATAWGATATVVRNRGSGNLNNNTIGMWAGGAGSGSNVIDYVTVQTTGACTDYGDMVSGRGTATGSSDRISGRGVLAGGNSSNVIEYMAIGTSGTSYDFGDLTAVRAGCGGVSSDTRMCIGGGVESSGDVTTIEFITIATTGNSADFGDLTTARGTIGGIQGS